MYFTDAKEAWKWLSQNILYDDERTHYEETFEVDDANDIETADLNDHNYKYARILWDYFDATKKAEEEEAEDEEEEKQNFAGKIQKWWRQQLQLKASTYIC